MTIHIRRFFKVIIIAILVCSVWMILFNLGQLSSTIGYNHHQFHIREGADDSILSSDRKHYTIVSRRIENLRHQSAVRIKQNGTLTSDSSHIQRRNGSFRPSFSLQTKKYVRVEDISSYNEFEYEYFNITPPMFAREEDREMFYRFKTGLDLLDPIPYIKLRGVVEVIRNGSYSTLVECGWPSNYASMHNVETREGSNHFKKACPIFTKYGNIFQHFTDELLPKLIQVRDILLDPEMKIVIPIPRNTDTKYINDVLERIGFSKEQIVLSNGRHFTADWMLASCITPPLHPVLWRTARALLGVHKFLPVPQNEAYVILLMRVDTYNGGRRLLNHQSVVDLLYQRYGTSRVVVFKGGYSLKDAVDLFGRTRLIIGVHGGALYNLNFAPRDAKILEIMPHCSTDYPRRIVHTIFWAMSNLIGQQIWRVFVEAKTPLNDVFMDTRLLTTVLAKIEQH